MEFISTVMISDLRLEGGVARLLRSDGGQDTLWVKFCVRQEPLQVNLLGKFGKYIASVQPLFSGQFKTF